MTTLPAGARVKIAASRPYSEDGTIVVEKSELGNIFGKVGEQRVRFFAGNLRFTGRQAVVLDEHVIHEG